jgi:hypothetical protein
MRGKCYQYEMYGVCNWEQCRFQHGHLTPCINFINLGKCSYRNCNFSHVSEEMVDDGVCKHYLDWGWCTNSCCNAQLNRRYKRHIECNANGKSKRNKIDYSDERETTPERPPRIIHSIVPKANVSVDEKKTFTEFSGMVVRCKNTPIAKPPPVPPTLLEDKEEILPDYENCYEVKIICDNTKDNMMIDEYELPDDNISYIDVDDNKSEDDSELGKLADNEVSDIISECDNDLPKYFDQIEYELTMLKAKRHAIELQISNMKNELYSHKMCEFVTN